MTGEEPSGPGDGLAYVDGDFVPASEAVVPLSNPGFAWGYTVNDTLRTFNRTPHALAEHADRLVRSARAAEMRVPVQSAELQEIVRELLDRNDGLLGPDDEFLVSMNLTGDWRLYPEPGEAYPPSRLFVRCVPLDFARNARVFVDGRPVVTSSVVQPPPATISPAVKHRSRLHFVVADKRAKAVEPNARPILLDVDGHVTETIQANVFVVTEGRLRTPPARRVLQGVTRARLIELARSRGREVIEADLTTADLHTADEAFLTSTSRVITPVTSVDGEPIGTGRPGSVTDGLLTAYGELVGVDIPAQFLRHLEPDERPERLRLGGARGPEPGGSDLADGE